MATNGFMIMLFGVMTIRTTDDKKSVPATTATS
jgi:hypothetical protein